MPRSISRFNERVIRLLFFLCAALSIFTTAAIIWVLASESYHFFKHDDVSIWSFLTGTRWAPLLVPRSYGVLPLVCGTFLIAGGALLVAVPIGVGAGIFLSEYSPPSVRGVLKPILEILAGVPTVVYGYFALVFITPYLIQPLFPSAGVFNAASAAIVVGIMIIPTVASLCDDAFRAVPRTMREAGYALAATRLEVSTRIVLPAGLSGVVAAILLAFARAVGETMAVAVAAGAMPNLTLNPLEGVQTMTSYIVQISQGDTPHGTLEYQTIFAVGMLLFLITLFFNYTSHKILGHFWEVYE
jgi:phosphate transport system permease protein